MTITYPLLAGILTSMLHVVSGPDHLAAVTPLAIKTKRKAWKIGLFWGLGHILGMLLIGILFLLFKEYIPVEKISENSEKLVAIILIAMGVWVFYQIFNEQKNHKHPHIHLEKEPFIHIHKHKTENHQHTHKKKIKQNIFSSFGIGFIHGLAGVAHFLLLLPALSFKTNYESTQYIIGFAIGTIIAMSAYALVIGKIANYAKQEHNNLFFKGIQFSGGLFAIIIGIYWLFI